jgi:hypothetical protein
LQKKHRLRVFENRVLRKIFGPRREEDGSWRKLHNNELHYLYSSRNIVRVIKSRRMSWVGHVACRGEGSKSRRMSWAGHVVCRGEGRGVYRVLVARPKYKRPLGRPRHR